MGGIVVLVPEDEGEKALAQVTGVQVVRYGRRTPRAEVIVPPFLAGC